MNPYRQAAFKREIARAQAAGLPASDLVALLAELRESGEADPYTLAFRIDQLLDRGHQGARA